MKLNAMKLRVMKLRAMTHFVANFMGFELGWFACVWGAANGMPWLALVAVAITIWLHLVSTKRVSGEVRLILLAVAMGLVFDSFLMSTGWLKYPSGIFLPGVAPYWILAMWAMFATTLNVSMSWIKKNLVLAAVLGAIFGPLSYLAGERLGGLQFIDKTSSIVALAVIWSIAMPLLVLAARRLDGSRAASPGLPLQGISRGWSQGLIPGAENDV